MHYEQIGGKLLTRKGAPLLILMLAGLVAFVARFALGLGPTTNLSDNYPWGLWIVFDLVWIALAGGAFVTAGMVYVFRAERFHALARPAVLMGLLSYSFVVVTLLADLGLPWHFWHLAIQRPEHSAMFEVSWCVTLYVTVLALEFAPTLFERFRWTRLASVWRSWSPVYTVAALGWFTYLMSHKAWMGALALVLFGGIAYLTRASAKQIGVPVILVIAAVTFSMMHQSSLGSLFLLMPDKLSALWWSPILPLLFFASAVVSGLALVMVMDMAIARVFRRRWDSEMSASLGRVLFFALAAYLVIRIGDVALRGQLALLGGPKASYFLVELGLGGLIPLVLFSSRSFRARRELLLSGAALTLFGVILNRANVVLLGMSLPGTVPGGNVLPYYPSLVEWALALSLVAAAVFFFSLGVKLLPVLPAVSRQLVPSAAGGVALPPDSSDEDDVGEPRAAASGE